MPLTRLEHLIDQREWDQARQEAEFLLQLPGLDQRLRCRLHRYGCRISAHFKNYYASLKHGEQARRMAAGLQDRETEVGILFHLGVAHLWTGDTREAIEMLTEYVARAGEQGLDHMEGKALFNLALAHRAAGNFDAAIRAQEQAVLAWRRVGDPTGECSSLLNIAWCHLLQGDHMAAVAPLQAAEQILRNVPDQYWEQHLVYCKALYQRMTGDLDESDSLCRLLWALSSDPEVIASTCWIAGENAMDRGELEVACRMADWALEAAKRCPFPAVVERAYQLLRRTREELAEEILP